MATNSFENAYRTAATLFNFAYGEESLKECTLDLTPTKLTFGLPGYFIGAAIGVPLAIATAATRFTSNVATNSFENAYRTAATLVNFAYGDDALKKHTFYANNYNVPLKQKTFGLPGYVIGTAIGVPLAAATAVTRFAYHLIIDTAKNTYDTIAWGVDKGLGQDNEFEPSLNLGFLGYIAGIVPSAALFLLTTTANSFKRSAEACLNYFYEKEHTHNAYSNDSRSCSGKFSGLIGNAAALALVGTPLAAREFVPKAIKNTLLIGVVVACFPINFSINIIKKVTSVFCGTSETAQDKDNPVLTKLNQMTNRLDHKGRFFANKESHRNVTTDVGHFFYKSFNFNALTPTEKVLEVVKKAYLNSENKDQFFTAEHGFDAVIGQLKFKTIGLAQPNCCGSAEVTRENNSDLSHNLKEIDKVAAYIKRECGGASAQTPTAHAYQVPTGVPVNSDELGDDVPEATYVEFVGYDFYAFRQPQQPVSSTRPTASSLFSIFSGANRSTDSSALRAPLLDEGGLITTTAVLAK